MREKVIVIGLSVCLVLCLCTVDLEGRWLTTVETCTNIKKIVVLSPFNVPFLFISVLSRKSEKTDTSIHLIYKVGNN